MHARVLLPNRAADPRWGFLDKFEDNPYLPRALAMTALVALAVAVVPKPTQHTQVPPRPARTDFIDIVIGPPPNVVQNVRISHAGPKPPPPVTIQRPRPVAQDIEVKVDEPVHGGGMDIGTNGPAPIDAGASDAATGSGASTLGWPEPDEFIPVETEPVLVAIPKAQYPDIARDAGIEGTVLIRVLVGEDGFVRRALVAQSVLGLDEAALESARDAVFRPALQQERPVAVWVVIPIEFRLRD